MTTFILHGGATSKDLPENNHFFSQFTSLLDKKKIKILLCYFAREKKGWKRLYKRDVQKISKNAVQDFEYSIAENISDLFEKLPDHDVLYVAGGEAELLEAYYDKLAPIKSMLENKIYIGSSMGVFMAAESYVLSDDAVQNNEVHQGLALLPIQALCHSDIDKNIKKKKQLLINYSKTKIITLKEGEFVEILIS